MKKKRISIIFGVISILIGFTSCDVVFEPDISNEDVILNAPTDNVAIYDSVQRFWWEKIEQVEFYNLQIVKPSFEEISVVLLDTLLTELSYDLDMTRTDTGAYVWRVVAWAGESRSHSETRRFDHFDRDLSNEEVNLLAPGNSTLLIDAVQTFWWEILDHAQSYNLVIVGPSFNQQVDVVLDTILDVNKINLNISNLDPGTYEWTVIGRSGASRSDSLIFSFEISDFVSIEDEFVELLSPSDDNEFELEEEGTEIEFKWDELEGAIAYELMWSTDLQDLVDNTGTTENATGNSHKIRFLNSGNYYWKVRGLGNNASDGNISKYSEIRSIKVVNLVQ